MIFIREQITNPYSDNVFSIECVPFDKKKIKCVVWDLDNTLWDGILLECDDVIIKEKVIQTIKELDKRGILNSIASKNDYDMAEDILKKFHIFDYFLCPMINWGNKSESIDHIAKELNLSLDNFAFIDDQIYELEEIKYHHPQVLCLSSAESILELPAFQQQHITTEAGNRRKSYQAEINRKKDESKIDDHTEFLKTLDMVLTIRKATKDDLYRASELTNRTHQMNTTGLTYSVEELNYLSASPDYHLLIADLEDRYGPYGKIGIALIQCLSDVWNIKLFLLSCRVMNRGIATVFLSHIVYLAREKKVRLFAEFKHNDRNRMMYITYKFNGFYESNAIIKSSSDNLLLEYNFKQRELKTEYIKTIILDKPEYE